jgi:arsenate reductase
MEIKKILFICTGNSVRSQMAEAFTNLLYKVKVEAFSGGTKPSTVNPYTIQVMKEIGIDISNKRSKSIIEFYGKKFDLVITLCDNARKECPFFPGAINLIHKSFEDPTSITGTEEEKLNKFRKLRDQVKSWLIEYFQNI